jgi:hypothetical protein
MCNALQETHKESMRIAAFFLALTACTAQTEDTANTPEPADPFPEVALTGVVREHTLTVTSGDWTVQREDGETLAEVDGYHINGAFIGPTILCDLGDTLAITLDNQTDVGINLQPHGLYANQATARTEVAPGEAQLLEWTATEGHGTFYYAASHLDEAYFDDQALSGILGLIVVRAEKEEDFYAPTRMLNYIMLDLYEPAVAFNWDILNPEDEVHNFTLVPQTVDLETEETTTENGMSVLVESGDIARVNVLAYGEAVHVLQLGGHTWKDRATRQTTDTWTGAPGNSDHFFVQLDNPGTWRVGSPVDDRRMYMTSWLLVQ